MTDEAVAAARAVIERGLQERAFPAAVVNVGRGAGAIWRQAFGRLSYADEAAACELDTIFDLASLTKVIATASLTMRQVARGLSLDTPVAEFLQSWRAG